MSKTAHNNKIKVDKVLSTYAGDSVNRWKSEVWDAYKGQDLVYHKDKTVDNCWVEYGLISSTEVHPAYKTTIYNTPNTTNGVEYPIPVDLANGISDYLINLQYMQRISTNKDEWNKRIYDMVANNEINWEKFTDIYFPTFLGSPYFTHAWDAKGVNLGWYGWGPDWKFKFTYNDLGNPIDSRGFNKNEMYNDTWTKDLTLPYFFAGSNIMKIQLQFEDNVRIINADSMFKALQVWVGVSITDTNGSELKSTAIRGFCPYVMNQLFKQTGGNTISGDGDWIFWSNCHSATQFLYENWKQGRVAPFKGCALGEEALGNVFKAGYSDMRGTHPNYGRSNWGFLKGNNVTSFGPLVDMEDCALDNSMFDSTTLTEIRIKNLNNGDWEMLCPNLDSPSVEYLINNLYPVKQKYEPYEHLDGDGKKELLNRTKTLKSSFTLTVPKQWEGKITEQMKQDALSKGWTIVIKQ